MIPWDAAADLHITQTSTSIPLRPSSLPLQDQWTPDIIENSNMINIFDILIAEGYLEDVGYRGQNDRMVMAMIGAVSALVLMFVFLVVVGRASEGRFELKYDEMQRQVVYRGYRRTALAMAAGCLLGSLFCGEVSGLPFDGSFALLVVAVVPMAYFVVYCMARGVYFGISGAWRTWTFLMILAGTGEVFAGSVGMAADGLPGGVLRADAHVVMLLLGAMFLVWGIASLVCHLARRGRDA